jgi:multimeric flavodoxin WrbA
MKALVLSSSPRRNGNSALLAEAVSEGLAEAGHETQFVFAEDFLDGFLRDCRKCRKPNGECSIEDGFRSVFLDHYLPADGFIAATPIYWYGTSAQLKAFLDRTFCYYAASYPQSAEVVQGMQGKRIGLVLSSEETFPRSTFVGVVHGYGNSRGDVLRDPSDPIKAARRFGNEFFTRHTSDYQVDTVRSGRMWG